MSEETFTPQLFYFDTNPLLGGGWPNPSAQLLEVLARLDNLDMMYCLPEVVMTELEEHTIREMNKDWNEASTRVARVMRRVRSIPDITPLAPLPSKDTLRAELRNLTGDFTERFTIIPMTSRPLSEFVDLAINRGATFTDGGEGFQDAIILCSVLDHMKENEWSTAVFVSGDKAFQSNGATSLIEAAGVTLRIVNTLGDVHELIQGFLSAALRDYLKREHTKLMDAFRARKDDLEKFLIENLTFKASDLGVLGNLKEIKSLRLLSIDDAHAPFVQAEGDSKIPVQVSVEGKVSLDLDIEQYAPPYFLPPAKRFKVGGHVADSESAPPDVGSSLLASMAARNFRHRELQVVVEAEAQKSEVGYSDIRLTKASLRKDNLWAAMADSVKISDAASFL